MEIKIYNMQDLGMLAEILVRNGYSCHVKGQLIDTTSNSFYYSITIDEALKERKILNE